MLNPDQIALQFAEGLLLDMIAEMDRFLSDEDAAYEDWCERVVPKRHDDCFAVMQIIVKALHGAAAVPFLMVDTDPGFDAMVLPTTEHLRTIARRMDVMTPSKSGWAGDVRDAAQALDALRKAVEDQS